MEDKGPGFSGNQRTELEEHLASLRSEGQINSRGVFTVDWEAARRKLSKAQLLLGPAGGSLTLLWSIGKRILLL